MPKKCFTVNVSLCGHQSDPKEAGVNLFKYAEWQLSVPKGSVSCMLSKTTTRPHLIIESATLLGFVCNLSNFDDTLKES